MSYPLRLPAELDAEARERCKRLGISLNALIAVALDAYLSRGDGALPALAVAPAAHVPPVAVKRAKRKRLAPVSTDYEPSDWRYFDPDPAVWPFVDPDPAWQARLGEFGADVSEEEMELIEKEYWSTRKRPE